MTKISVKDFFKYEKLDIFSNCFNSFYIEDFVECLNSNKYFICLNRALHSESPEFMQDLLNYMKQQNVDLTNFQYKFFSIFGPKDTVMGIGDVGCSDTLSLKDLQTMEVFLKETKFVSNAEKLFIDDFSQRRGYQMYYEGLKKRYKRTREIWKMFFPWFTSTYYNIAIQQVKTYIINETIQDRRDKYFPVANDILTIHPVILLLYCFERKNRKDALSPHNICEFVDQFEKLDLSDVPPCTAKYSKFGSLGQYYSSNDGDNWTLEGMDY